MANSCPPKKVALEEFLLTLNKIDQINPSISREIKSLQESIEDGMVLRGGFVKRGGGNKYSKRKISRKHRGGMPPKLSADEMDDAVLDMTDADRSALLNAMAHIISIGTITGGAAASFCYIVPAIESYLVSNGLVPMLCSGEGVVGMLEWGFRIVVAPLAHIETCMAIQSRYDLIVKQIIAAIGIPSGFAILYEKAKIRGGYLAYKNAIYNILEYCVVKIKGIINSLSQAGTAMKSRFGTAIKEPQITPEQLQTIVDQAIQKEFPELELEGPSMAGPSMAGPSMAGPSMATRESQDGLDSSRKRSQTPQPSGDDDYEEPESNKKSKRYSGGYKRRRKRKTAKKRTKTSRNRKLRTQRTRRHRTRRHRTRRHL